MELLCDLTDLHRYQGYVRISEQLASLNERMDELLSRVSDMENKVICSNTGRTNATSGGASIPCGVGSLGSSGGSLYGNGIGNGCANGHALVVGPSSSPPSVESTLMDEVSMFCTSSALAVKCTFMHAT